MPTKTKTTDVLGAFEPAYAAAVAATTELRLAYTAADEAQRLLVVALAEERERARVAFVEGRDHVPTNAVEAAQDVQAAASERVRQLKAADEVRQAALSLAVRDLVDGKGREALADAIARLVDAGSERLDLAVDELAAARRQLAQTVGMLNHLDGTRTGGLREANALTRVRGLTGRDDADYDFATIEDALRGLGDTARACLQSVVNRPAPPALPRVPMVEMLRWNLSAGGSLSDSTAQVIENYLEHGPRRDEAAQDARERTRDQRTWSEVA